ncbi:polymorphic toxin type 15 domain-containing protein [Pseudomonas sp. KU26590]|uniref:DUF6861 domain-containing protein n=1 Tax=Pseudomonas sp. KU26590 TaxID=2991051 RepID=UPI00223CD272|nr:polymorphic toxin type 15 domain-containing protein [Pseudomonas sp. KU26590]UZJ60077.1 polymorphic toxin type 15 domain-containing protein [Pseudomonas sp. KU26590]
MRLWNVLPSWFEIEDRLRLEVQSSGLGDFRSYLNEQAPSVELVLRRVDNIRTAFYRVEFEATALLRQRFADLDIADVLFDLMGVVGDMAMIIVGSVLAGGAMGAGVGALAGGVGAGPGAFAGMAIGLQASSSILGVLGLASVAEFFVQGLPALLDHYVRGIQVAWDGTRGNEGLNPISQDDPWLVDQAAHHIARGHTEVVILLLGAVVEYLTRGRGNMALLAGQMRASSKGARLAQWMLKHEEGLKGRPDLQPAGARAGGSTTPEPRSDSHRETDRPGGKKPLGMPEYKVPCFNASNLHYSKIPEFDRQRLGQERGLNDLTVDEYLRGREAFKAGDKVRDPRVAKQARKTLEERFIKDTMAKMELDGTPLLEARRAAKTVAREKMSALAALHNPDLFAGGKDIISDFGDARVNSSIGAQWRGRIDGLDHAASTTSVDMRDSAKIHARLERCK